MNPLQAGVVEVGVNVGILSVWDLCSEHHDIDVFSQKYWLVALFRMVELHVHQGDSFCGLFFLQALPWALGLFWSHGSNLLSHVDWLLCLPFSCE